MNSWQNWLLVYRTSVILRLFPIVFLSTIPKLLAITSYTFGAISFFNFILHSFSQTWFLLTISKKHLRTKSMQRWFLAILSAWLQRPFRTLHSLSNLFVLCLRTSRAPLSCAKWPWWRQRWGRILKIWRTFHEIFLLSTCLKVGNTVDSSSNAHIFGNGRSYHGICEIQIGFSKYSPCQGRNDYTFVLNSIYRKV